MWGDIASWFDNRYIEILFLWFFFHLFFYSFLFFILFLHSSSSGPSESFRRFFSNKKSLKVCFPVSRPQKNKGKGNFFFKFVFVSRKFQHGKKKRPSRLIWVPKLFCFAYLSIISIDKRDPIHYWLVIWLNFFFYGVLFFFSFFEIPSRSAGSLPGLLSRCCNDLSRAHQ